MEILADNVRMAYKIGLELLAGAGRREHSRVGDVMVSPEPVMTIYRHPEQRVLLNETRDANPFFHFFESIWMLAGCQDGKWLNQFVHDFTERFADHGTILHGAYGWRWRHIWDFDQLLLCTTELRKNPSSRRAVIQMWDAPEDLCTESKDLPCNTTIFLRVKDGHLDMMVNCRSNDIIWGAYGANAVHMSMLQEWMAASIGVQIGKMYQNSFNYHAYVDILYKCLDGVKDLTWCSPYESNIHQLVDNAETFLHECEQFVQTGKAGVITVVKNSIWGDVAVPMMMAHELHREKKYDKALKMTDSIMSDDWKLACSQWIQRRIAKHERKDIEETVGADR